MNKIALTDVEIRQMKAPTSGRREIRDTKTPGLWLRVAGSGSKSFVVRGYLDKKPVRVTLGQYPVLSLRDARSQALAIQSQLHQGIDPRKSSRPPSTGFGFAQILDDYAKSMQRKGEATGRPSPAYRREVDRLLRKEFGAVFGSRDIRDLTKSDIMDVIYAILDRPQKARGEIVSEESPSAANHALSYVKTLFAWCESQGRIDNDVTRRLASPAPKNKRDRVLTDDELAAVWHAARDLGYPYGDTIRLLLVTGQRRSEVARLRWEDLALAEATWNVNPHNKSSRPYQVPLPRLALEILKAVPMRDQALVFGAPNAPDKEFSAWSKNKVRLDKLSDMTDFVVHDLRRTAGTNLVRLGVHPHVRERVLTHVIPGVEGVYDRHSWFTEKRDALNTYDAFLRDLFAS